MRELIAYIMKSRGLNQQQMDPIVSKAVEKGLRKDHYLINDSGISGAIYDQDGRMIPQTVAATGGCF